MKRSRTLLFFLLAGHSLYNSSFCQTISTTFFGQNYWRPNRTIHFNGELQNHWTEIEASGIKYMRIGGKDYDANGTYVWTSADLASGPSSIVTELRSHGIEPIIQVPIDASLTAAQNATAAATLVNDVNNTYSGNVTYWIIGNEPDGSYASPFNTAAGIQSYIQAVSTAMKGVSGQSGIKIIGPSITAYNPASNGNMMSDLIGGTYDVTGSGANGYYIDIVSFHIYPFRGQSYWQTGGSGGAAISRSDVISYLTATGKFNDDLTALEALISAAGRSTTLGIAITEANISYEQNTSAKGIMDLGPGSFLGGQFWAEMMGIAMKHGVKMLCFWSAIEGSSSTSPSYITDIGYIGRESGNPRSTYWHYKLMAENFKGTYYDNILGNSGNYKAFAYRDGDLDEMGVLIMNQDIGSNPTRQTDTHTKTFIINFKGLTPTSGYDMSFSFNLSDESDEYHCTIPVETTMLLVFDGTNGTLKRKQSYSLIDALRATDTGTYTDINNSTDYNGYTSPSPYNSDILIGTNTATTITAGANKTITAGNSIKLNGPFNSSGYTVTLTTSKSTCYSNP
ncbi:MAG: hypothetical protein ACJ76F_09850 [Bacteroidia bacterium]